MGIWYRFPLKIVMSETTEERSNALKEAMEQRKPRFFRAGGGVALGKTGREDTEKFASNLMALQECALLLGEKLDMNAVAYSVSYDNDETIGFCYDQNSNPHSPDVVGGIVNRRMPMGEFLASVRDHINE